MFRLFTRVIQQTASIATNNTIKLPLASVVNRIPGNNFSTITNANTICRPLLANTKVQDISNAITRNLIKFSWGKGRRKTCSSVLQRFYRLDWGIWIHAKCGRHKKIWKKHAARKRRLRQHVFCNASQSLLLDKMVTSYWRKPKYYVDDPYEPYHKREEFMYTYKKPRPFIPLETSSK